LLAQASEPAAEAAEAPGTAAPGRRVAATQDLIQKLLGIEHGEIPRSQ
jgi:hypothetical protein